MSRPVVSRRSVARRSLLLLALSALLAAPGLAEHHEQAEAKAAPSDREPMPAEIFERLVDVKGAQQKAPDRFEVELDTTKGKILIEVHRDWAPHGADRFYSLVKVGYFEDIAFFRVMDGFMTQFGMHGNPRVNKAWTRQPIEDDPVERSNERGTVSFAKTKAPNSRTTQLFINTVDNANLDKMGFSPFGRVIEGMDVVDSLHVTGEGRPRGAGPSQRRIKMSGNVYLRKHFPDLDYVKSARIVE